MAITSSRTKSSGPELRSQSPSGRFCGGSYSRAVSSSSSSAFASSSFSSSSSAFASSSFSSPSSAFFSRNRHIDNQIHHRSASPTRVSMSQPLRYSLDARSISPTHRSISVTKKQSVRKAPEMTRIRRCMCSPTTHPGSFRCSLHKNVANPHGQGLSTVSSSSSSYRSNNGLNMRRSAMTNSLVRIGGVEGEWVRRALTTLIRPSSHHLKRRDAYEPRPSRLSIMSKASDS